MEVIGGRPRAAGRRVIARGRSGRFVAQLRSLPVERNAAFRVRDRGCPIGEKRIGFGCVGRVRTGLGDPGHPTGHRGHRGPDVGHPGRQAQTDDDRGHHDAEDQQPHHRTGSTAAGGERFEVQHPVDTRRHQRGQHRRRRGAGDGAQHLGGEQPSTGRTQRSAQQNVAEQCAGHEPEAVGGAQVGGHQLEIVREVRSRQRRRDLDGRDGHDDDDGGPRLFAGVEDPELQQHQGVRDQGEGRHRDRDTEVVGVDFAEIAVGEQCAADRRPGDGHERHDRDERDHGEPGRE